MGFISELTKWSLGKLDSTLFHKKSDYECVRSLYDHYKRIESNNEYLIYLLNNALIKLDEVSSDINNERLNLYSSSLGSYLEIVIEMKMHIASTSRFGLLQLMSINKLLKNSLFILEKHFPKSSINFSHVCSVAVIHKDMDLYQRIKTEVRYTKLLNNSLNKGKSDNSLEISSYEGGIESAVTLYKKYLIFLQTFQKGVKENIHLLLELSDHVEKT